LFTCELNKYFENILIFLLENLLISETRINRYSSLKIRKFKELQTYKGIRHMLLLPVHGQRTRTNANTQRSKRLLNTLLHKHTKNDNITKTGKI
jgi:ribosomal protein S13